MLVALPVVTVHCVRWVNTQWETNPPVPTVLLDLTQRLQAQPASVPAVSEYGDALVMNVDVEVPVMYGTVGANSLSGCS